MHIQYSATAHPGGELLDGTAQHGQRFTFTLGDGAALAAIETCVASMSQGEVAELICTPEHAFGPGGGDQAWAPHHGTVRFEIELCFWGAAQKNPWELSLKDRIELAEETKAAGTQRFKSKDFEAAAAKYLKVTRVLRNDVESEDAQPWLIAGWNNAAACQLKLGESRAVQFHPHGGTIQFRLALRTYDAPPWGVRLMSQTKSRKIPTRKILPLFFARAGRHTDALASCTKVLEFEPGNTKAMYRSAQAHLGLEDYQAARDVLRAARALDPANASVQQALKQAESSLAAENKAQQQVYAGMFAS